jgi:transposase
MNQPKSSALWGGDCPLNQMPQAYSNDLRRKFFEVYDAGEGTLEQVAKRFRVSLSWAKKISARRSKTGEMEAPQWRRGPVSRVMAAMREWMREQIRRQPDLTLLELQQRLQQSQRLRLSLGWIWVVVRQLGLALKKNRSTPRSRTASRRSSVGKRGGSRSPR